MLNSDYSSNKDSHTQISLLAIVGPTASGKSQLAMMLATLYEGEIIAADSRTVYREMDIGTAKPNKGERKVVPHWGLDLVAPGEAYSAYQFKDYADKAIDDIRKRGKLPILVGGTGLYIDAVIYDFQFKAPANPEFRRELEGKSIEELHEIIKASGYPIPVNSRNKRHLVRTIETGGQVAAKSPMPLPRTLVIGLLPPDEMLLRNINTRAEKMFQNGLIKETEGLLSRYGKSFLPSAGIVYRIAVDYLEGRLTLKEAKDNFMRQDWQYARRQRTWFRRNKFIHWYDSPETAFSSVSKLLSN